MTLAVEELAVQPHVHAVLVHEDGDVALEPKSPCLERLGSSAQLALGLALQPDLEECFLRVQLQDRRQVFEAGIAVLVPLEPGSSVVALLEDLVGGVGLEPRVVFPKPPQVLFRLGGVEDLPQRAHLRVEDRRVVDASESRQRSLLVQVALEEGLSAADLLDPQIDGMQGHRADAGVGGRIRPRVLDRQDL